MAANKNYPIHFEFYLGSNADRVIDFNMELLKGRQTKLEFTRLTIPVVLN